MVDRQARTRKASTSTLHVITPPESTVSVRALREGLATVGVMTGDALAVLRELPAGVFNVAVTSPPYYWARDYEVSGQIGHEDSVDEYVSALAAVFRELRRVLHPEGVFYLNIGDTYYSGNGQPHGSDPRSPSRNFMRKRLRPVDRSGWGIPKKSLIGVPWKVAFAMQKDGWTLRSDIIWNRGNAFTEPTARDRPYRQYEHLFLFSKTRFYSFDRSQLDEAEDVWTLPIERTRRNHSASFPSALVRRCILTGSPPGGHVIDPFVGSGTTLDVAVDEGRSAVGVELNAKYTNDVVARLQARGCLEIEESELHKALRKRPSGYKTWRGNIRNFRKPRTLRRKGRV